MKQIFFLLLFFQSLYSFSQDYFFDNVTTYLTKFNNNNEYEKVIYTNSKIDDYCMFVDIYENRVVATIIDYKINKKHFFNIEEIVENNKTSSSFKYSHSEKKKSSNLNFLNKVVFDFKTIDSTVARKKIKFTIFKNDKKKGKLQEFILDVKDDKNNVFNAFRISCLNHFEFNYGLNIDKNVIIENAIGTTLGGDKISHKLLGNTKINVNLVIPKQ